MYASGKSASRPPFAATSAASDSILSIVAERSSTTGSAWTHATVTGSFTAASLFPRPALTEAAAARCLDSDHVPGADVERRLGVNLTPVHEVPAGSAGRAAALTARRVSAPLRDDREPARLEHAQLADDAVAAAPGPRPARPEPQPVALDPERVLELERLDRRRERVGHRDVHAARPVGVRARA